jgi:hypothetical protein
VFVNSFENFIEKDMHTAQQIESIEAEAWESMFDIAPAAFRKEMNLYYEKVDGATCFVFPKFPVVHFNMVIGLGFAEVLTKELLQQVEDIYRKANQSTYMIQFCEEVQKCEPGLFELMNYRAAGGWERITWKPEVVIPLQTNRDIQVKEVTTDTAAEWERFILEIYKYPAYTWVLNFVNKKGWHHFLAYENSTIVGCRSIFISKNNFAWSGVEAPVPIVMTSDLTPDRVLWKHLQEFCFKQKVELIAADIEVPSPQRDTPIYQSFNELGFKVEYLRKLYRKK